MKQGFFFFIFSLVSLFVFVSAVDRSKFRTCNDAGFCRRHRNQASEPEVSNSASYHGHYHLLFHFH